MMPVYEPLSSVLLKVLCPFLSSIAFLNLFTCLVIYLFTYIGAGIALKVECQACDSKVMGSFAG